MLKSKKESRSDREGSKHETIAKAPTGTTSLTNCFDDMENYFCVNDVSGDPSHQGQNVELSDQKIEEQAKLAVAAWIQIPSIPVCNDPLIYWGLHCKTMPLVAEVARKHLCCMATSAECERAASTAGRVVDDFRSRLDPENVRNLVFLHDSHSKIKDIISSTVTKNKK